MVAALELHELVAAGGAARQPDRAHRRLGARGDQAHHVDAGDGLDETFGELDLELRGCAERRPTRCGGRSCLHDLRPRVSEQQRSPRLDVVHVADAVDVGQERALAVIDETRDRRPPRRRRGRGSRRLPGMTFDARAKRSSEWVTRTMVRAVDAAVPAQFRPSSARTIVDPHGSAKEDDDGTASRRLRLEDLDR